MSIPAAVNATSNATLSTMLAKNTIPGPQEKPEIAPIVLQNPEDGAVIRIDDDRIAARAQNGDLVKFYRDPMNYEFQTANATIGDFSNGTIAASENGNLVVVRPDSSITLTPQNAPAKNLGTWKNTTGIRKRLVGDGYISAATFESLEALCANGRDLSEIPAVNADFAKSTDHIFHTYQQADIVRRWRPSETQASTGPNRGTP